MKLRAPTGQEFPVRACKKPCFSPTAIGRTWDYVTKKVNGQEVRFHLDTTWGRNFYFELKGIWYTVAILHSNSSNPGDVTSLYDDVKEFTAIESRRQEHHDWRSSVDHEGQRILSRVRSHEELKQLLSTGLELRTKARGIQVFDIRQDEQSPFKCCYLMNDSVSRGRSRWSNLHRSLYVTKG